METGPGRPLANVWLTSSGVTWQPKTGGSLLQNNALLRPTQMRAARRGPDRREGDGGERVRSPCVSRHPATGSRKEKEKKDLLPFPLLLLLLLPLSFCSKLDIILDRSRLTAHPAQAAHSPPRLP